MCWDTDIMGCATWSGSGAPLTDPFAVVGVSLCSKHMNTAQQHCIINVIWLTRVPFRQLKINLAWKHSEKWRNNKIFIYLRGNGAMHLSPEAVWAQWGCSKEQQGRGISRASLKIPADPTPLLHNYSASRASVNANMKRSCVGTQTAPWLTERRPRVNGRSPHSHHPPPRYRCS